jgi:hypothetical protein
LQAQKLHVRCSIDLYIYKSAD